MDASKDALEQAARYHLQGVAAFRAGETDRAAGLIAQAIRLRPLEGDYYADLGAVLQGMGQFEAAESGFRAAIHLKPSGPSPYNGLGSLLREQGRLSEAAAVLSEALKRHPKFPQAHYNLGCVQRDLGQAVAARASFETARALWPTSPDIHNALGNVLKEGGQSELAAKSFKTAIDLKCDFLEAYYGYGGALCDLGRLEEALDSFSHALRLAPENPKSYNNMGVVLQRMGQPVDAVAMYRRVLALDPDNIDAPANLALALLLLGQYEEGWRLHETRWKSRHMALGRRHFDQPMWDAGPERRTVLVHAEQGFGDTLQFCRYVPLIAERHDVVFEVQPALVALLRRTPGVQVIARGQPLPAFEAHCPLMSLPFLLGTTLETLPQPTPYLHADPAEAATWKDRLSGLRGLRVGLVWAGGARPGQPEVNTVDRRRSLALKALRPLAGVSGVHFISLQKGAPSAQLRSQGRALGISDFTEALEDFADTAALIANLDLVISVDTAVAHLAGAMGKPVWLLNRFDTCWRWLLDRDDSPWYPTLRLFRQPAHNDWATPIEAVRRALSDIRPS